MRIGNHRAPFIDYRKPGIFMITVNRLPGLSDFSRLRVETAESNTKIGVNYHALGFCVFHALKDFKAITPRIEVMQYVIMPNHLHFLLEIKETMERALGDYIAVFKRKIFLEASAKGLIPDNFQSIFEPGFNDQFLRSDRNLNTIYEYIRSNPYRLWAIRTHTEYFRRINETKILDTDCSLYGNLTLLQNPFIYPVVIHRKDTEAQLAKKMEIWRYVLVNGGVLAGAFISKAEKKIFEGAAQYGGKIILIQNKAFEKKEKPSGQLFKLCEQGQLLIISPKMEFPISEKGISRQECLAMNAFAERLSASRLSPLTPFPPCD